MHNKLHAIIVDDELHGRENLKKIIETYCEEINIIACADSAGAAQKFVAAHKPDVVFLDINMPELDGFDFLDEYDDRDFSVVFVSAHEDFGIKAVKAGAADYLLKPVSIKELKQTVKKLLSIHSEKKNLKKGADEEINKLVLPTSHGFDVLPTESIIRLEAEGCYTKVILKDEKHRIASRTLKDFEATLPKDTFYRVHKSHIINLKYIKEYSNYGGYSVTLLDGSKIELSRRKAPGFIRKIKTALKTV